MIEETKPHEAIRELGIALEGVRPLICEHQEFKHDCPKCLRQEIRRLKK